MEDMASKISELLSDPKGMEKIKSLAETLFKDNTTPKDEPPEDTSSEGFGLPDEFDISKIMGLMSAFTINNPTREAIFYSH